VWDIREKTSLLPRSCASFGHLPALGVSSLTCPASATGNGSLPARARTVSIRLSNQQLGLRRKDLDRR